MVRQRRIDRIPIRFDSIERDSRGFAKIWGTVIKSNSLLTYDTADGEDSRVVEFVPESTVNDPKAIESLIFSPITMGHPPEMLDSSNTSRYQVGTVIDARYQDGALQALHMFTDRDAIDRIERGDSVELSPGYTAEIDDTPGNFQGHPFHRTQQGRLYNHESVVTEARGGRASRLFLDSKAREDGLLVQVLTDEAKETKMATITIDGETIQVSDEAARALVKDRGSDENKDDEPKRSDSKPEAQASEGQYEAPKPDKADPKPEPKPEARADDALGSFKDIVAGLGETVANTLEARDKARADAKAKADADAKAAAKEAFDHAKDALPKAYSIDGKSAAEVYSDAILGRSPDLKPRVDAAKGDTSRLLGMLEAELARTDSTTHPLGNEVPNTGEKDIHAKRSDAIQKVRRQHKVLGNEAMRHHEVASIGA